MRLERLKAPRGNPHGRKVRYVSNICAFDIESTRLEDIEQSIMYIWQMQINEDTIIGRYWNEFMEFLLKIKERLNGLYMVIYVHNLSYEFQFLKGIYDFEEDEVFCTDSRKVLKCTMLDAFEFRCSYIHSNMSLERFIQSVGSRTHKLDGSQFDYKKKRYPWTELSDYELQYCINDVQGLTEAIRTELEKDGDTLYTIPLTSTGYPRRECKKAMKAFNHRQLAEMLPDARIYELLREAFRGGNTHANRFYANEILENVKSMDRSSSYPDVLVNYPFPMGPWFYEGEVTPERLKWLMDKRRRKAIIFRIGLHDLKMKDPYDGCPYLSRSKCRWVRGGVFDNGRILSADYLETTLTDIDFRIVKAHYTWSGSSITDCAYCRSRMLPEPYRDVVKEFYSKKTHLKGIDDYYYNKAKNKLNGLYGMGAQDPCKDSIVFQNGEYVREDKSIEELIIANNKKAFLSYAWGVWCTAWARYCLQEAIDIAGGQFVYCDTDSVKYLGDIDLTELNERYRQQSEANGAYADDPKGKRHYMGVYEPEGSYDRFKTMGAKKYAYEEEGKLHITIAGVNKMKGAEELGTLDNMREGFTFHKAGGTESVYNDGIDEYINIDGHRLHITDNVVIRDSTYTLGITAEYAEILLGAIEIKYSYHDIDGLYKAKK